MDRPILDWHYNDQYPPRELAEHLGNLPFYIFRDDFRSAIDQINDRPHGLVVVVGYTGLPALAPAARAQHMGDTILVYPLGFTAIAHADSTFSVARVA